MTINYTTSPSLGCRIIWPPEMSAAEIKSAAHSYNDNGARVPCHVWSRDGRQIACAALGSFGPMHEPTHDSRMYAVIFLEETAA